MLNFEAYQGIAALAPIDPLSAALVGYGVNWTLDGLFSIGGQGRALSNALGRALSRFRDRYPDIMDVILADDAWRLLREELKLLVSADQQPDAGRLARQLAGEDEEKAQRLQAPLSELLLWVRNEAALEPKLVGIQNFRIGEGVASRLADFEQALGVNLDVTEVLSRGREASQADIEGFYDAYGIQDYARQAELRYGIGADDAGLGLEEIVELLCTGQRIVLEGRPGFGKSTTALRIAEHLAEADRDVVPLFMPVSEWALGRRELFEEFASRDHFSSKNLSAKHIQFLAERKRVVLILDGWNELSGEKFQWVHSELQKLLRYYTTIGLIVTLRPNGRRPPIKHALAVTLSAMDIGQRDAVIKAKLGDAAERVIDRLWRQRDLDEITRIPLYLSTYLHVAASDIAPSSKEELLREFVRSHESEDEHRLPLQDELSGLHDEYMIGPIELIAELSKLHLENFRQNIVVWSLIISTTLSDSSLGSDLLNGVWSFEGD